MGMCRWDRGRFEEEVIRANRSDSTECVHVIDLPPAYETAIKQEYYPQLTSSLPLPPTYEMACSIEKLAQSSSSGTIHHI